MWMAHQRHVMENIQGWKLKRSPDITVKSIGISPPVTTPRIFVSPAESGEFKKFPAVNCSTMHRRQRIDVHHMAIENNVVLVYLR